MDNPTQAELVTELYAVCRTRVILSLAAGISHNTEFTDEGTIYTFGDGSKVFVDADDKISVKKD